MSPAARAEAQITRLRLRNYRVLKDVTLDGLAPVAAFLGPNGSGKSTVFDAVQLLQHAVTKGVSGAWEQRGGMAEIRTRGASGPVEIDLTAVADGEVFDYRVVLDEDDRGLVVTEERLSVGRSSDAEGRLLLQVSGGEGTVHSDHEAEQFSLTDAGTLAAGVVGQFARHPQVAAFRRFVSHWQTPDLDVESPVVRFVETPENQVYPLRHHELAEDIRMSVECGQIVVTTHSPAFVNALRPEEVWAFHRGPDGCTRVQRAADLARLVAMFEAGTLGSLWTEGYFGLGDPLSRAS